ncbi:enolase-phosphatase E1-like isoform X1 [Crassostrea angulata]|uniref:enolase-phosphatase E1-like isoform X1 n=1 Tax=Magallana angulata TaxID=2784310 RepID=UPI0022B16950|nr:enolase-phosphatase E1-like isoform X1 [Crassostrea angulata]
MEEGSNGADLNNSDNDSSDVSHQNGFNNSTYTMEIGIAKLDSSYLENHMQCAKAMHTSSSPQSAAGRVDLCDLSTEGANPTSLPQNVYEEIGEVSKEGNSREKFNRSRSLSSEDVFASSDSDDYLEPVSSPKSVNTDDSLPCSPTKMDDNSPEISNEYEALSPATQVCTSYTSLTLKSPNQSTADDISDTKEADIYDNCDVYNIKEVPNISALETSDNQIDGNSEKTTSDDHQQNENLLINVEDEAIELGRAKDEDEQVDDDVKDSCSVKSDQGSVEYLDDDISCDIIDEFKTDENVEDTNEHDKWDTIDSENQCELNLSALESINLIEDELTRNEFVGKVDVELNSLKLRNKIDEDMKDSSSVASVQGSVSYLDDISCITDDNLSISTGRADQCLSEVDYKEFSEEGNKESLIDSERKPDLKQYSRDDNHTCSSANSESDLDQIPSNLVKRLSQQFSKSMGDLRYVPFPFAARKASLPGHYKVTYKSSTFLILSPNSMQERQFVYEPSLEEEKGPKGQKTTRTKEEETRVEDSGTGQTTETTTKTTTVVENGDVSHESQESSARKPTVQEEIMSVEGGVYENEPVREPGVVRESDPKNIGEELPEVGMAKNILQRYAKIQEESAKPVVGKRQASPPKGTGPSEYISEPRTVIEKPEQKIEGGIFENQPISEEGVVKSYDTLEDVKPEQGYAKNVLAKFKEIESQVQNRPPPSPKRELTPDRFTKGEYVSEPRSTFEKYEGKTESGIFESQPREDKEVVKSYEHEQEVLPEQGMAKNLVSKFKDYQSQTKSTSPREKKELTPDRLTKGEYVSEPRTTFEQYEGQVEAGVYESKPQDRGDIVKSGEYYEEPLPEEGYAKNVISKFKDIQKGGGSPAKSPSNKLKELTPPRQDTFSGVLENQPQERSDVVHSYDVYQEEMPETGTTRNLLNKFKEIQHSGSNSPASPRLKKEFTPPPQSGVYENTPTKGIVYEERVAESGILENNPERREGVAREEEPSAGTVEFPERGYAKNMVSKWKQLETEHSKSASPSPRYKEFTPPREEPRIKSPLSPKSPAGTNSSVHPRDLPGQYQEQQAPGIYENDPSHRDDIAREEDTDWEQGLPREGTSKSLISKFKNVQDEAKKSQEVPKPISRRDSTDGPRSPKKKMFEESSDSPERGENAPSSVGTEDESIGAPTADNEANPKSPFVAVQLEKCAACQKTVYAMEKIEMNKNCYHRACFKCSHCNSRLTAKTFSMNEGVIYCTNHFKQLFARKGNYDEGFGRQQYKKRWQGDQPNGEKQTVPEPTA